MMNVIITINIESRRSHVLLISNIGILNPLNGSKKVVIIRSGKYGQLCSLEFNWLEF